MKYVGSKNRISKKILPIILRNRKPDEWYVEPFCGGCNILDKVKGKRIANDANYYLIELLKALRDGWLPPKLISENEYNEIKTNVISNESKKYDPKLIGYVGFQLSYGAMFFSSYRRDRIGKRDYSLEAYNNVKKQAEKLKDVIFTCKDYKNTIIPPEKSTIYLDPPYKGKLQYNDKINHDEFWDWVRDLSIKHDVYISEYSAPEDFKCVWSEELRCEISKTNRIEKLFILN